MTTVDILRPSKGRIVIFTAWRGHEQGEVDEYASHVVGTDKADRGIVDLVTFGPQSTYFQRDVPYHPDGKAKTWRYPPHVAENVTVTFEP